MLLDTDLMKTFVAIAETGSFTRAAEMMHRTPSAISMQVKRLEEMLDRSLFHREARSVRLTLDGEKLLGYGRRLLSLNEEAVAQFTSPRLHGCVRLGAPDDFGMRFLPNILSRFAKSHPEVDVDVVLAPSRTLMRRLKDGEVDLSLLTIKPVKEALGSSMVVYTEPLVWVGLKGGCAFQSERLPLALAAPGCTWRDMALKVLDDAGQPYRIAYTSEQGVGQLAAVMADLAIAPLPISLIDQRFEALDGDERLPQIGHYQIVLQRSAACDHIGDALADHVSASFGDMRRRMTPFPWH